MTSASNRPSKRRWLVAICASTVRGWQKPEGTVPILLFACFVLLALCGIENCCRGRGSTVWVIVLLLLSFVLFLSLSSSSSRRSRSSSGSRRRGSRRVSC